MRRSSVTSPRVVRSRRSSDAFLHQFAATNVAAFRGEETPASTPPPAETVPPASSPLWQEKIDPRTKRKYYVCARKSLYANDREALAAILRGDPVQEAAKESTLEREKSAVADDDDAAAAALSAAKVAKRKARAARNKMKRRHSINPAAMPSHLATQQAPQPSPRGLTTTSWDQMYDVHSGRHYFYNRSLGRSVWAELPSSPQRAVAVAAASTTQSKVLNWHGEVQQLFEIASDAMLTPIITRWSLEKLVALCEPSTSSAMRTIAILGEAGTAALLRQLLPRLAAPAQLHFCKSWKDRVVDDQLLRDAPPAITARVVFAASSVMTGGDASAEVEALRWSASDVAHVLEPMAIDKIAGVLVQLPAPTVKSVVQNWSSAFCGSVVSAALSSGLATAEWAQSVRVAHASPPPKLRRASYIPPVEESESESESDDDEDDDEY